MKLNNINLPEYVNEAMTVLEKHGYSSFVVGGSVRDSLMNKIPYDYDICTSALPEQIVECFTAYKTIETGIKHGTVTVVIDRENIEITTFRKDGEYDDHRRPDEVEFVSDINEDLSRRDFTMNAIAYSPKIGFIDPFGGIDDIKSGLIKTVGNAKKRFGEDSLRMLRALRFASTLGFEIEKETKLAIKNQAQDIKFTSAERQCSEIKKMILGEFFCEVFDENRELIFEIIPELSLIVNCTQECKYHCYDVFYHTLESLKNTPLDLNLRLAILLHDIGKPKCKKIDEKGQAHFKKHPKVSADMARIVLERLRFDKKTTDYICLLIANHSTDNLPKNDSEFLHFFRKLGAKTTTDLFRLMYCDLMGKSPYIIEREKEQMQFLVDRSKELEKSNLCYKISDLDIKGNDLLELGFKGKKIGEILERILFEVIEKNVKNEKNAIITYILRENMLV